MCGLPTPLMNLITYLVETYQVIDGGDPILGGNEIFDPTGL